MYINAEIVSGYYKGSYKLSRMYGYRGIWYRGKQKVSSILNIYFEVNNTKDMANLFMKVSIFYFSSQ